MRPPADRAVSEVMGSILIFGFLIAALGLYQLTVVPANNEDVEQRHSATVREDMLELRSALLDAGYQGSSRSIQVSAGTQYPARALALNPPPPNGRLTTEEVTGAVSLSGVEVVDGEADDYWQKEGFGFDTAHVVYRPAYNYYEDAPVVRYEPTVLYSGFEGADVVESNQGLVDGSRLNLVLVEGSVSGSMSQRLSLDVRPGSTATQGVRIVDDSSDSSEPTITVKTRLSREKWEELLDGEPATVADYRTPDGPNEVDIELTADEYTLRVAEVGLDRNPPQSAEYIVMREEPADSLRTGESTTFSVQVLDEFGNPVEGQTVKTTYGDSETTDETGIARFSFSESNDGDTSREEDIKVWFGSESDVTNVPDERKVVRTVSVVPTTEGENLLNPATGFVLTDSQLVSPNEVRLEFSAPSDQTITVEKVRINYFHVSPGGLSPDASRSGEPDTVKSPKVEAPMKIGGEFKTATSQFSVAADETSAEALMRFCKGTKAYSLSSSDYFIFTLTFDGNSRIYFASPSGSTGGEKESCNTSP